jgi:hypothetical protein
MPAIRDLGDLGDLTYLSGKQTHTIRKSPCDPFFPNSADCDLSNLSEQELRTMSETFDVNRLFVVLSMALFGIGFAKSYDLRDSYPYNVNNDPEEDAVNLQHCLEAILYSIAQLTTRVEFVCGLLESKCKGAPLAEIVPAKAYISAIVALLKEGGAGGAEKLVPCLENVINVLKARKDCSDLLL